MNEAQLRCLADAVAVAQDKVTRLQPLLERTNREAEALAQQVQEAETELAALREGTSL